MEARTRFTVDLEYCRRAEDELYEILKTQEIGFATRWNESRAARLTTKISIAAGLIGSGAGLVTVGVLLFLEPGGRTSLPYSVWLAIFAAFFVVFVFMPKIGMRVRAWSLHAADRRARRNAMRGVREALRLVPYEADYDYKSDALVYSRGKDGKWQIAWTRPLGLFRGRGLAIQRDSVTAVFRRPRSLTASMVILQQGREWTAQVLRDAGVPLT